MIETTFLSRISLFADLSPESQTRIGMYMTERTYSRGEVIFRQGEPGEHVHFVREGRIKVSRVEADGREHIVKFFDPGEGFGLIVALDLQPYPSTATAIYPSRVWSIRVPDWRQLVQEIPGINSVGLICANLRAAQDRAQSLAVHSLQVRLAKFLLSEADLYGRRRGDHLVLPLSLTHEDLAGLLGAARESVSRVLSELRRFGAVQDNPNGTLLLDLDKLREWLSEH